MSFKLMKLPVLTGISSVEQYNPKTPIEIFSVRFGMPCLIINKQICDLNGNPFTNEEFQSDFKKLAIRMDDCAVIGIGVIFDKTNIYSKFNRYSLNSVHKVTYNSRHYTINKDNICIEMHDIQFLHTKTIAFNTRLGLLSNIVKSMSSSGVNVELPINVKMETFDKAKFNEFIKNSACVGNNVVVMDSTSIYIGGEPQLNQVRSFILNPFQEVEDEVVSYTTVKSDELSAFSDINVVIEKVRFKNSGVEVDYSKEKEYVRSVLIKMINNKSKIKFESAIIDGKYYYSRPL